ncbi:MAG: sigma-54 dependent transcriptional regulator [Desulfobulbaceae bacterium]|nr:sigma-54 dependent transcriptional regulator [Desulfobulbaceae bacterium]
MSRILIIDDDLALCRSLELQLKLHNHEADCACDVTEGLALASSIAPDLMLLDINLPGQDGLSALPDFIQQNPQMPVVIMTGEPGNQLVVEAMHNGAVDYLRKPFELNSLLDVLNTFAGQKGSGHHALEPAEEPAAGDTAVEMIGAHPLMTAIHKTIGLLSRSRVTVLIHGESGTGKELAARILHQASTPGQPFVGVNCSAVVPTLLESEFFGHEKGAFTGADRVKIGKLEYAGEGTVFLDEIGDMPQDLQGKLLRVLQEEEFVRVGGLKPIPLKARIVAATHCDLEQLTRTGRFRQDLFYRLAVSTIELPSLRKRREDIPMIAEFLLRRINRKLHHPLTAISQEALDYLSTGDWPGNVRELENVLTRAVALAKTSILSREDLGHSPRAACEMESAAQSLSLVDAQKHHIQRILTMNRWNITHSARILQISPTTLRKKIADFQLKPAN